MTEKRFTLNSVLNFDFGICDYGEPIGSLRNICELLNELHEENTMLKERRHEDINELSVIAMKYKALENENEQLKQELNKLKKFEYGGEHIRLSINIETGELQRHIYATGQWFGDFDRVLVDNWLSKEDYQRFINRVIEVYNTEFKKGLEE